jgi:N6-L-threonylcarbamoyladenine synthase
VTSSQLRLLALETSCDETAAAVAVAEVAQGQLSDLRVLASGLSSQAAEHAAWGGVVPEVASRAHLRRLPALVRTVLRRSALAAGDLDAVAAVAGPGLAGALLVGHHFAKGLAWALRRPYLALNHLEGHVYAALLTDPQCRPPLLALIASGGHTDLVWMEDHGSYRTLGRTRDDAAGEAFDKGARLLGLAYPGGPALESLAGSGDAASAPFPRPRVPGLDFSFSGLKTALLRRLEGAAPAPAAASADLAAGFEAAVVGHLLDKLVAALRQTGASRIVLTGGVAANRRLRFAVVAACAPVPVTIPPIELCTDNAAMAAACAAWRLSRGEADGWDADISPAGALHPQPIARRPSGRPARGAASPVLPALQSRR